MSRFLPYELIERRFRTSPEMLQELADRLMAHPPFQDGRAIVFGSVAWGKQTWRSDLDIAYSCPQDHLLEWWKESLADCDLYSIFATELGHVFGESQKDDARCFLIEELGSQTSVSNYESPRISPSTADHFRLLAKVKRGPWSKFNRRIKLIKRATRGWDISEYVHTIAWIRRQFYEDAARRPFHIFDGRRIQALENFPKQLTRKILGLYELLPCPDTHDNIMQALSELEPSWARELVRLYEPFFAIHNSYTQLVDDIYAGRAVIDGLEYNRRVLSYLRDLPYRDIAIVLAELSPTNNAWRNCMNQLRFNS